MTRRSHWSRLLGAIFALAMVVLGSSGDALADAASEQRAFVEIRAVLRRVGIRDAGGITMGPENVRRARAAGITEAVIGGLVERALETCLAGTQPCGAWGPDSATLSRLLMLLEGIGTERSASLLWRLRAREVYLAASGLHGILERLAMEGLASCAPPSNDEVAAMRPRLADFAALRARAGRLVAEAPTGTELDDLAYFLVATEGTGAEIHHDSADGSCTRPAPTDHRRDDLRREFQAASFAGDLTAYARAAESWLGTFGYPGTICVDDPPPTSPVGRSPSSVMRELAEAYELLGRFDAAEALYRRASANTTCGNLANDLWELQVKGAIRSAERAGRCRHAVAERMFDLYSWQHQYDPQRLRDAGFDLVRLYRGALVTLHRDADEADVVRALEAAPVSLRAPALARWRTRGREDWERRVEGLEGFADTAQRGALATLVAVATDGTPDTRRRALATLAELAYRAEDLCEDEGDHSVLSVSTDPRVRSVRAIGSTCRTALRPAEEYALVHPLVPLLADADPEVREGVARVFGAIGSAEPYAELLRAQSDSYTAGQSCVRKQDGTEACAPYYPVREAVREAIERIDAVDRARR